jgi:hypothetical protein
LLQGFLVTVSLAGLHATPESGVWRLPRHHLSSHELKNCHDHRHHEQLPKGAFGLGAQKQKAYMTKTLFRFANGQMTKNGKLVN